MPVTPRKSKAMADSPLTGQAAIISTLLMKIMRGMFSALDGADPTAELPLTQVRICKILFYGHRSMSSLSRDMGISLSAITQIADRLERAHLVERVTEGEDRRVKSLQLTAYGEQIMQARNALRAQRVEQVIAGLPIETRTEIVQALQQLLDACTEQALHTPDGIESNAMLDD